MASSPQVVVVLHKVHYEQIKNEPWLDTPDEVFTGTALFNPTYLDQPSAINRVELVYGGRNPSSLEFLPRLEALGIAYDARWAGHEVSLPGTRHSRYGPTGAHQIKELEVGGQHPPMAECLKRIDDPDALRQFILDHQQATRVVPWKNQVEFGKRYRARELLKCQ